MIIFLRRLFGLACWRCRGTGIMVWHQNTMIFEASCTRCGGTGKK